MRDFNAWLGEFRNSIADYKYYIDFPKVFANVDAIKIELNILNSLIGSRHIEADFESIIERYPETLKCIPILLAKREMDIFARDEEGQFCARLKIKRTLLLRIRKRWLQAVNSLHRLPKKTGVK